MAQITPARDVTLADLHRQFKLKRVQEADFFPEWYSDLPTLSEFEHNQLARVQQNYANLSIHQNFSEEAVKMVVLSPLLDLARLYQAPFVLRTEEPVEISSKDEEQLFRGKIDVLVTQEQLWILVIESKSTQFDVLTALPQALTYLLSTSSRNRAVYGLLVNGREFVFVKLVHQPTPQYMRSAALSIEQDDEFAQVLKAIKKIRDILT